MLYDFQTTPRFFHPETYAASTLTPIDVPLSGVWSPVVGLCPMCMPDQADGEPWVILKDTTALAHQLSVARVTTDMLGTMTWTDHTLLWDEATYPAYEGLQKVYDWEKDGDLIRVMWLDPESLDVNYFQIDLSGGGVPIIKNFIVYNLDIYENAGKFLYESDNDITFIWTDEYAKGGQTRSVSMWATWNGTVMSGTTDLELRDDSVVYDTYWKCKCTGFANQWYIAYGMWNEVLLSNVLRVWHVDTSTSGFTSLNLSELGVGAGAGITNYFYVQPHTETLLLSGTYYSFLCGTSYVIRITYTTDPKIIAIEPLTYTAEVGFNGVYSIERDDSAGTLKFAYMEGSSTSMTWWSVDVGVAVWDGLGAEWTEYSEAIEGYYSIGYIVSNMGYETTIDTCTGYINTPRWKTLQWFRNPNIAGTLNANFVLSATYAGSWDYGVTRYHTNPTWISALGSMSSSTFWYITDEGKGSICPIAADEQNIKAAKVELYSQGDYIDGTGTHYCYPMWVSATTGDLNSSVGGSLWSDDGVVDGYTYNPEYKSIESQAAGYGGVAVLYDIDPNLAGMTIWARNATSGQIKTAFHRPEYSKYSGANRNRHMVWASDHELFIFRAAETGGGELQVDKIDTVAGTYVVAAVAGLITGTAIDSSLTDVTVVHVPDEDAWHVILQGTDAGSVPYTELWEWTPSTEQWTDPTTPVHTLSTSAASWTNLKGAWIFRWELVGAERWLFFPQAGYGKFVLLKVTPPNYTTVTEVYYAGDSSDFTLPYNDTAATHVGQVLNVKGAEAWVCCTYNRDMGRYDAVDRNGIIIYTNHARLDVNGGTPRWTGWIEGNLIYNNDSTSSYSTSSGLEGAFVFPALTDNMFVYGDNQPGFQPYIHWVVCRADMWDAFTVDGHMDAALSPEVTLISAAEMSSSLNASFLASVILRASVLMSSAFNVALSNISIFTAVKNVLRKFSQAWTVGSMRKVTSEEYIVGTDYYNDQLSRVNALRVAEGVGSGVLPLNSLLDMSANEKLEFDWATYQTRQMVVHDLHAHYDLSFDEGWQSDQQKFDTVFEYPSLYPQPSSFSENIAVGGGLAGADPEVQTALWYSEYYYTSWYNSPPHHANMVYDWVASGRAQDKVFFGTGLDWTHNFTGFPAPASFGAQQFYDFTQPTDLTDNEMERVWNSEYVIAGAEILQFTGQYSVYAWVDVKAQIGFKYSLHITKQFSFHYGARVGSQIAFPTHYTVTSQIGFPYTGLLPIAAQVGFKYDMLNAIATKQIGFPYSSHVESSISFPYGDSLQAIAQIGFPYSLRPQATTQIGFPYAGTSPIAVQQGFVYDLLVNNPVISSIAFSYALIDATVITSTDQVTVTVGGLTMPVLSADVSISEGDFVWRSSVRLKNLSDYNLFIQDSLFQVNIGTDTYEMVVEEKSIQRGENTNANVDISIVGLSPAIQHKSPRADVIDFGLTTATLAKDVVESILGATVQWNAQNWMIPAYRLSATDISPIKLVKQIVEVIGAIPEALYDGTLQIRYTWEINTDQYDAVGVVDHTYTDVQDNLSATEQTQPFELFNKFRIREGNGIFSDVIEFFNNDEEDGDNTLAGILRAYPNPWRLNVRIIQTNNVPLPLNIEGVVQRQETQLVEFTEGTGSVTYPIVSVDSIEWVSDNLGSLVHEDHGRELTTPTTVNYGYGLAEITYTTEAIEYTTSAPISRSAQFLLEDLG